MAVCRQVVELSLCCLCRQGRVQDGILRVGNHLIGANKEMAAVCE